MDDTQYESPPSAPFGRRTYNRSRLFRIADDTTLTPREKGSVVNIIQNSKELSLVFTKFKNQLTECPVLSETIKNLQMSKIRFNSCTLPIRRWVLFVRAVVLTAV